jgi:hypothetical protein
MQAQRCPAAVLLNKCLGWHHQVNQPAARSTCNNLQQQQKQQQQQQTAKAAAVAAAHQQANSS